MSLCRWLRRYNHLATYLSSALLECWTTWPPRPSYSDRLCRECFALRVAAGTPGIAHRPGAWGRGPVARQAGPPSRGFPSERRRRAPAAAELALCPGPRVGVLEA